MKKYGLMMLAFGTTLAAIPMLPALLTRTSAPDSSAILPTQSSRHVETTSIPTTSHHNETIDLLDASTGEVRTLPMLDYIIGAVCAEMPASFEEEALKAQAVAVHTYACRQQLLEEDNPTPELCGADLSNDSNHYQAYFTKSQTMQFYGTGYDSAIAKITAAVEDVLPYTIEYQNEPILAAFCSMSPGTTESAENVWGKEIAYLVAVDSAGDENAPNFLEEVTFSAAELKTALQSAFPESKFDGVVKDWLTIKEVSDSGTVLHAMVGGTQISGQDVRSALGLRSAAFEIKWEGDVCTIRTKGFGHGVGMSQYGANAMAKAGADWQEILNHYYPGSEIVG